MHTGKGACDAMRGLLSRDPASRRFRRIMDMGKTPDDPHVYITTVRENVHFSMRFIADESYACGQKIVHLCIARQAR